MPIIKNLLTALKKIFKNKKRPLRRKKQAKKIPVKRRRPSRAKKIRPRKALPRRKARKKKKTFRPPKKVSKAKKPAGKNKFSRAVKAALPAVQKAEPQGLLVGEITHYFSKIMVCVVDIKGAPMKVGDQIKVKGSTTDFVQTIKSLQIESQDVKAAHKGQLVGLKVKKVARGGDKVYKL